MGVWNRSPVSRLFLKFFEAKNHQFIVVVLIYPAVTRQRQTLTLLDDLHTFHCSDYFVLGGIRACLGVPSYPMLLWISSNSCSLNLLLVQSYQAETIIVKRLIQGRNQ